MWPLHVGAHWGRTVIMLYVKTCKHSSDWEKEPHCNKSPKLKLTMMADLRLKGDWTLSMPQIKRTGKIWGFSMNWRHA